MKTLSKLIPLAVFPVTFALLASCATMKQLDNISDQVTINSTPAGAAVGIDGVDSGKTPYVATLKRNQTYRVTVAEPGYTFAVVKVGPMPVPEYDHWTGSTNRNTGNAPLGPNPVNVKLTAVTDPMAALAAGVLQLDQQLKSKQITAAQHKQYTAELVAFYKQTK